MRKKVIAGNWKMNNDLNESINLVSQIKLGLADYNKNEVIVCPSFTSLESVNAVIKNSVIKLGAQNLYYEDSGAYTGEISAKMLKSVGCEYVIIGHSERRTIFQEKDELINLKIKQALSEKLKVIFCIGETLEERENDKTFKVINSQLSLGLKDLSAIELNDIIIAYEPVWAIGTGKTATPQQAQEVHKYIRDYIRENFTDESAENLIIQYGGSVKPDNAAELLNQPDIDGALVGGACLKSDSFLSIIKSV
ncbi:MAG: triose-phosphate isomerase [Melioribacteraceae bacterium]|nr:triose-phosphate isomerase [Melioribacteraceae bacterium]